MFEQIARKQECTYTNTELECKSMLQTEKWHSASLVGKAGIAPLSVTVNAPQALANLRASLSKSSFYNLKPDTSPTY